MASLALAPPLSAEDSVAVPDMDVDVGEQGVAIPLMITNASELVLLTIPVMLRSTSGGAFPSALGMKWRERLPEGFGNPLSDIVVQNRYDSPGGAICKGDSLGGFKTISIMDTLMHPVIGEPIGAMFVRGKFIASRVLKPGRDTSGSAVLLIDAGHKAGTFEVDTTCTAPQNHLSFFTFREPIPFALRKGTITVHACDCPRQGDTGPRSTGGDGYINLVDVVTMISEVFLNGAPAPTDPHCPHSRSDIAPPDTCGDGVVDAVDLNYLIDYAFRGGAPICDPCVAN